MKNDMNKQIRAQLGHLEHMFNMSFAVGIRENTFAFHEIIKQIQDSIGYLNSLEWRPLSELSLEPGVMVEVNRDNHTTLVVGCESSDENPLEQLFFTYTKDGGEFFRENDIDIADIMRCFGWRPIREEKP